MKNILQKSLTFAGALHYNKRKSKGATKYEKFLSILLSATLILTASPFAIPFLTSAEEAAPAYSDVPADYVTDGLVSFYDANNYTDSAWTDLAGENDITALEGTFQNGAYFLDGANGQDQPLPDALLNVIKGTEFTVEFSLGSIASTSTYATLLCNTGGTEKLSLYAQKSTKLVYFKTSSFGSGTARPNFALGGDTYNLDLLQDATLSFTYKNGDIAAIYLNGVLMGSKTAPASNGNNIDTVTGLVLNYCASGKVTTAEYKGLRFYDKALSVNEVLQNRVADSPDYVKDGLVSLYDGNDYTETAWTDRAGENDITELAGAFQNGAYLLDGTSQPLPTELLKVIKGEEFTVEFSFGSVSSASGTKYTTFLSNNSGNSEKLSLYIQNSNSTVYFKTSGITPSSARPQYALSTESADLTSIQNSTLSFTYKSGDVAAIYLNGELLSSKAAPASNGNNVNTVTTLILNLADSNKKTTAEYKGLRFYDKALSAAEVAQNREIDALSYVTDGLVSFYDGNNYTDTTWTDLAGDNDITDTTGTFVNGAYLLDGSNGEQQALPTALLDVVKGEEFTVEIALGSIASNSTYATLLCNNGGYTSEMISLYAQLSSRKVLFKTSGIVNTSRPSFSLGNAYVDALKNTTLSFTYKNGDVAAIYLNGILMASAAAPETNGNDVSSANNFVLNIAQDGKITIAEYEGLRFYSKALTAAEVAQNYQKDLRYIGLKTEDAPEEPPLEIDTTVTDNTASYVQNGLVARFDAEYNVEGGHANNAKEWVDTVNGYTATVAQSETNYFTSNAYHLSNAQYNLPTELLNVVNGSSYTVELALGDIYEANNTFVTFLNSTGNDNFSLFIRTAGDFAEFKSKSNARPKVMDGLNIFSNSTVTITFDLEAGVCILYVDGVEISRAEATMTAAATGTLAFGNSGSTKAHTADYKELRFYNRALTAEEVAANAQADETYNPDYVTLTGFAETLQPETGIVGDVVLSEYIPSLEKLQALLASENIPANMIFYANSALEITNETGVSSGFTVSDLFKALDGKVIPTFYLKDSATASALAAYLAENKISDVFVMSNSETLVKEARVANPQIRGIIDYSDKFTDEISAEELTAIRKSVNSNMSRVVVLPFGIVTNAQIKKLNQGGISVWLDAQDVTTEETAVKVLLSGSYGIIGNADLMLTAAHTYIPEGTITRPSVSVAHRGFHADYPENTIEAFDAAYKAGADMVEVDIYLTTDGELAICHNSTTTAIYGTSLSVESCTMAQLQELYVTAADGTNCYLPSLRQTFEYFKDTDLGFMIEIKSGKTEIVAVLKALIEEYDMYDRCMVITFARTGMFETLLDVYPEMPVSYLLDSACTASTANEQAQMVQMLVSEYNLSYAPNYSGVTEAFIRANNQRGISTWLWTVNTSANIYKFTTFGAAGITSDRADFLAEPQRELQVDVSENGNVYTLDATSVTLLSGNATVEGNTVTAEKLGTITLVVSTTFTSGSYSYNLTSVVELNYTGVYDLNGDKTVDISDVTLLLDYLSNPEGVTLAPGTSANIDGTGDCDISDVTALLDVLAQ